MERGNEGAAARAGRMLSSIVQCGPEEDGEAANAAATVTTEYDSYPSSSAFADGYQFRFLMRKEATMRDAMLREEADDFRRLRTQCGRGIMAIISAITTLPEEMHQLALLRLHEDERRIFMLRPIQRLEHAHRMVHAHEEREAFFRLLLLRNEDSTIRSIFSRFYGVKASIASFLRAQWIVKSVTDRNHQMRLKFYTVWRKYATTTQRLRRIVLGLNRIRKASQKQLVHRYAGLWNHPIQNRALASTLEGLEETEEVMRSHMCFYEEECRARSCAEVLESVLFDKIVDEHFAVIGPLIDARRSAAALELEMLNAARLARLRLQTWYFWTVDRRNEAKVIFLREKAMFYSAQTRFSTWYTWCERRFVTRDVEQQKELLSVEMLEDVTRLTVEARSTARHLTLFRRARHGVRTCDLAKTQEQLSHVARLAKSSFDRRYFERWIMFASRTNIESRALFLARISSHVTTTRYYWLWCELHEARRHDMALALAAEGAVRSVLATEEAEGFDRIRLEHAGLVGFSRFRRLVGRVARFDDNPQPQKPEGDLATLFPKDDSNTNPQEDDTATEIVPDERLREDEDDDIVKCDVATSKTQKDKDRGMADEKDGKPHHRLLLPSARKDLRPLPSPDEAAAAALRSHMRLRFKTLMAFTKRSVRHRNAFQQIERRAVSMVVERYCFVWRRDACCIGMEGRQRRQLMDTEQSEAYGLFRSIEEGVVDAIADGKLKKVLKLEVQNKRIHMTLTFARLFALRERRRIARSKKPEVWAMQRRGEEMLMSRYVQYWRKVVSRARLLAMAKNLCRRHEARLLRYYWDKFPPNLLRLAKISKVRLDLQAAKEAAAEMDLARERALGTVPVGVAKGSLLAEKLVLKKRQQQPSK